MDEAPVAETIIVGYDDREPARDALALARLLARATSARLLLAHVTPFYPFLDVAEPRHRERVLGVVPEDYQHAVRQAASEVTDIPARGMAVYGHSPAQGLTYLAEVKEARLIVLGSAHHGRLGRVLPGSTAERLLHGSPCPVAVAPRGYAERPHARLEVIGCGFDGSSESRAALAGAESIARAASARLEVISVFEPIAFGGTSVSGGYGFTSANRHLREALREALDSAVAGVEAVAAKGVFLEGDPALVLAEHSRQVELLVAGSRRYGPLRAVLLGGVSGRLIGNAACPVLVVPRPSRPGVPEVSGPGMRSSA